MIGSNLVKRLISEGDSVTVIDNLWRGSLANLRWAMGSEALEENFVQADLAQLDSSSTIFDGVEVVST